MNYALTKAQRLFKNALNNTVTGSGDVFETSLQKAYEAGMDYESQRVIEKVKELEHQL